MAVVEGAESTFRSFISRLIDEKGLATLNKETREELASDLQSRLESLIHARILEALSEEELKAFEKMLNEDESAKLTQSFLEDKIPDYTNFISNVLLDFRRTYLS